MNLALYGTARCDKSDKLNGSAFLMSSVDCCRCGWGLSFLLISSAAAADSCADMHAECQQPLSIPLLRSLDESEASESVHTEARLLQVRQGPR